MANLQKLYAGSKDVYVYLRNRDDNLVWDNVNFTTEAWNDSHLNTLYAIDANDIGGQMRSVVIPANLPDGNWLAAWLAQDGVTKDITVDSLLEESESDRFRVSGGEVEDDVVDTEWYYADKTDVEDMMGVLNLQYNSNQENTDNSTNDGRLLRAGLWADAQMNIRLKDIYITPIAKPFSDNDLQVLSGINVDLVIAQLIHWRIIQQVSSDDVDPQDFRKGLMSDAMEQIQELFEGKIFLDAAALVSFAGPEFNTQAVDISGRPMYPTDYSLLLPARVSPGYRWPNGF
jgi:hypothetical protein